ncbi:MAG: hypothetical protein JW837_12815 [Sedimentisphaerales bacterium]|nr:hypothetical protein [Sedimentisphaerales bacterium]
MVLMLSAARSGQSKSITGRDHNDVVATIREIGNGKTADVRLSAREASTAISIVQTFTDAANSIGIMLTRMEEPAEKASSRDYSSVQIDDMQEEFKGLAT